MHNEMVFDFKPSFKFNKDQIVILDKDLMNSVGGVYICFINDQLQYIGSYSNTLHQRWVNKKLTKFIHFKADQLKEKAGEDFVVVSVFPMYSISEYFGNSPWINQESVESRLVQMFNPPMNVVKKNDKNKSSKT